MSDSYEDILKKFEENVCNDEYPRSIGLFTIPEYPEFESDRGMWSAAINAILTTLRYLAPATLLTLFWGQQSFLFKLLKHIDSAFRSIVFSSEEQKQEVLQWLSQAGPVKVEHLDTVWRHGWILCGVLDAALPGACAGHPPTRLSLKHAQSIADHYLGVESVFSRQELESNDSLSRHQEWKLANYLNRIQQALAKLTPTVSKPISERTSPETTQFTLDYVAKGSGLTAAQVQNKMHFKVYPTAQQSFKLGEINVLIRGPKDTYGMITLPPILGKAQLIRQKMLGLQPKPNFTENVLPITQGAAYLRSYGRNDMNKTYYIPKTKYDIELEMDIRQDHARISYVVNHEGKYEISITSRGKHIVGSPFLMTSSFNILSIIEKDSFCLEDGEEIDIVDVKTDRKVVLRIVDFVTEKMLLNENGTLEKISEDEAKLLMATNFIKEEKAGLQSDFFETAIDNNLKKFKVAAEKVKIMIKICKIFTDIINKNDRINLVKKDNYAYKRNQQDIPDIVNSTFNEAKLNQFIIPERQDKLIIPECISFSLRTEKSKSYEGEIKTATIDMDECIHNAMVQLGKSEENTSESNSPECLEKNHTLLDDNSRFNPTNENCSGNYMLLQEEVEDDSLSVGRPASNPFFNDIYEETYLPKDFGTIINTEYETNNSQSEETENNKIRILLTEENITLSQVNTNPFMEPDVINLERPKTPVFRIKPGDVNRSDNFVYINKSFQNEINVEEKLGNEFINPFFMHQHHQSSSHQEEGVSITDFVIGAPVSLPPIIATPSSEQDLESILITPNDEDINTHNITVPYNIQDVSSVLSNPSPINSKRFENYSKSERSTISPSLDSNLINDVEITMSTLEEDHYDSSSSNNTSRKDIWDSAYVSIDDTHSSSDNNDNASCETLIKNKFSLSDDNSGLKRKDLSNMGPAERELWETCSDLKENVPKFYEDVKTNKWEMKRTTFTPIIEESERSISSGIKDIIKNETSSTTDFQTDTVSVAFAELNEMYHELFPKSDSNSITTLNNEDNKLHSIEVEYIIQNGNIDVDSASEIIPDVKRQTKESKETISEVQINVTESVSASRDLNVDHDKLPLDSEKNNESEYQFGNKKPNIVLEKKKYWDDKIREITESEIKIQQRKRRLSSKHLRCNDSLTKRRGKQIVKNFLNASDLRLAKASNSETNQSTLNITEEPSSSQNLSETPKKEVKLVEKWKRYWDDKLEIDKNETEVSCFRTKSPKNKDNVEHGKMLSCVSRNNDTTDNTVEVISDCCENKDKSLSLPVKQELPEEVFKAFETSPRRFFGTSRKQILNKIDIFLGKPNAVEESLTNVVSASHDNGLVSSRISLFHSISKTEEVPWSKIKSQSLYNIAKSSDKEKSMSLDDLDVDKNLGLKTEKQIKKDNNDTKHEINTNNIQEESHTAIVIESDSGNESENSTSLINTHLKLLQKSQSKRFDETVHHTHQKEQVNSEKNNTYVKRTIQNFNKPDQTKFINNRNEILYYKSFSKSEMDIFNKTTPNSSDDDLDKYKSCDELPKISVKNFISLYEGVSKNNDKSTPPRVKKVDIEGLQKHLHSLSSNSGAENNHEKPDRIDTIKQHATPKSCTKGENNLNDTSLQKQSDARESIADSNSINLKIISQPEIDKETTFLSLSDIEIEIIENRSEKLAEPSPERDTETAHTEYKNRFQMAKQYFQSLEELRDVKKPKILNECELLLYTSNESLESVRPKKRVKKKIKSHSMPSSEIAKFWNQLQEKQDSSKLVKISEKFNVDDLFNDITEGKLSRQGSLRGIPHKKAVLETFRSMENISNTKFSPYEIAATQLNDFAKENKIVNAQTYLSEYPYLPTTNPSNYRSRLDTRASGLISLKELLDKKPRRNSVPDLRLNPKFTVDL